MAQTQIELYRLACSAAGMRYVPSSLTEVSSEVNQCNLWYDTVRRTVLHAAPWTSITAHKRLAVLAERDVDEPWASADPGPGWRYAYQAPQDMLRPRFNADYSRFELSTWFDGVNRYRAIISQTEQMILTYSRDETNVSLWDVELYMAVVHALAAKVVLSLTGKPGRAQLCAEMANASIFQARAGDSNVSESGHESLPDWLTARGYSGMMLPSRYVYPYGPMITVTEGVAVV